MTDDTAPGSSPAAPTPQQEAEVSAALRALADPVMPDDVAARLDSALRTAPPLPTASGGSTVLPLDDARARRVRQQRWNGRALGVAAGVAAALVVSGVVVSQLSGSGTGAGSTAPLSADGAESGAHTVAAVSSGTDYSQDAMPRQLNAVLASATVSATPSTAGSGDSLNAAPPESADQLRQCVTALTEGTDTAPLLADYARFEHRPALVVAVPGRVIVGTVEVFVVNRGCTGGPDLPILYYRLVKVTELPALAGVPLPAPTTTS